MFKFFIPISYIDDDGVQNYLIFHLLFKSFNVLIRTMEKIFGWKSKVSHLMLIRQWFCSNFTSIHTTKIGVKSDGNCLKQDKGSFTHGNMVKHKNFYCL